jgi:hypothetical protein
VKPFSTGKQLVTAVALAAVSMLGAGPASVSGQDTAGPEGPGRARDEAFKMVDAYIVSNLQESLGLTDEQFTRLLPLVMKLHNDRRDLVHRRLQSLRELRRLLASGAATEAQVDERLREVKRLESEEPAMLRRDRDAVDAALLPLQQAKFRVLESEVEQKIRGLRNRMQMERRSGVRGRRGAPGEPQTPQP